MRPMAARLAEAACVMADFSVADVSARTGLPDARISQVRSGARTSPDDVQRILTATGFSSPALIQQATKLEKRGASLDQLLAVLLMHHQEAPAVATYVEGTLTIDRLSIVMKPSTRGRKEVDEFLDDADKVFGVDGGVNPSRFDGPRRSAG